MATSTKISRHSLVEFAEQNFDSPIFSVNQYPLDSKLFVVENRDNYPIYKSWTKIADEKCIFPNDYFQSIYKIM